MASFLRRLVAKSRSSSPQKGTTGAGGNHAGALPPAYPPPLGNIEDDDWAPGPPPCSSAFANHVPNASSANRHGNNSQGGHFGHHHSHAEQYRLPDQLPMNSLAKALPNHVGHQHSHQPLPPPSPTSNRRSPPGGRPLTSKAQSPASFRQQPQQFSLDEPGTSSQEILSSPSLWSPSSPLPAHHWALRNSHSNPPTTGSSSQRPSSTQAGLTRLDELSSAQTLLDPEKRPRSSSPRKPAGDKRGTTGTPLLDRSRSPPKKGASGKKAAAPATAKTLDYLQAQCRLEGCSASILVEDSRFLVCKHQLSHSSDFFRTLFLNSYALPMEGVRHVGEDEYVVQVSSLRHPPQALQFQWFLETTVPSPLLRDISDDLLETCMRLCKRFAARGLEMRCTKFIKDNVEAKPPLMALCWLNWSFKHHFHRSVQDTCLPVVARLSLCQLEKHRQMLPEAVFADLLAMKLRTAYQQTSIVFHSIHRLDHFHVEMPQCPRCGRQREQGRVRVQASPCHKLIGCERCMRDFQCELGNEQAAQQMQAFWQCEHGLWPFSERTEDCRCQTSLYKANWASGGGQSTVEETSSSSRQQQQQRLPPTAAAGASGGRFASNLTLASKPSHSSRS